MTEIDARITEALGAEAASYPVPEGLAARTLEAASSDAPRWGSRLRSRTPRVLVALGAVAVLAVAFTGLGRVVLPPRQDFSSMPQTSIREAQTASDTASGTGSAGGAGQLGAIAKPEADQLAAPGEGFSPSVVRTAQIELRVPKRGFQQAWQTAIALATKYGGFVASSEASSAGDKLARGTLTLRVPAAHLDAALGDLAGLGTLVKQSTSANDVSGQLFDFDARIRTLETQELQFLDILKQARGIPEILEVRSRLNGVRAEIEQLKGRRQFLQQQVDLATLTATLFEPDAASASSAEPGRFGEAWSRAVDLTLTVVAGSLVVAGGLAPFAVLAAAVWLVLRRRRRIV